MEYTGESKINSTVYAKLSGYIIVSIFFMYKIYIPIPIGERGQLSAAYFFMFLLIFFVRLRLHESLFLFKVFFLLFGIMLFQVVLGSPPGTSWERIIFGNLLLSLAIAGSGIMFGWSEANNHRWMISAIRALVFVNVFFQIFSLIFNLSTGGEGYGKSYFGGIPRSEGLAWEPSYLSIMYSPLMFIAVMQPIKFKQLFGISTGVAAIVSALILGTSTNFFAFMGLAVIIKLMSRSRLRDVMTGIAILFIAIYIIYSIPAMWERVSGVFLIFFFLDYTVTDNASVLLFAKGAEIAYSALLYFPWGTGTLNAGTLNVYSQISEVAEHLKDLNKNDATSLLFRGIGEFGLFYVCFFVAVLNQIRLKIKRIEYDTNSLIEASFLFSIVADSIRSGSYFETPALIGFAIMFKHWLFKRPSEIK